MGGFYLQGCGATIGAKFLPSLTKLYMGWWKRSRIFGVENPFCPHIKIYLRFIDDLMLGMQDGVGQLDSFLMYLNQNNRNHFTGNASNSEICFLDVRLTSMDCKVSTTLFRKPLSRNTLLQA